MKAPAFQFYAQDFLTGVMYLTNEEKGIYITMLAKQWTDGKIPKKRLGFLVGIDWDNFSEELKAKFTDLGTHIINERLEIEREKKKKFREKQSENGKKGGRPPKSKPTKSKGKTQEKPNPLNNQNPKESQKKPLEEENEDRSKKNEKEKRKRGAGEKLIETDPDLIFPFDTKTFKAQWDLWKKYKAKQFGDRYKDPTSEQAALKQLAKKANGDEKTAIEIIHESMGNTWKGLFPLKNQNNGNRNNAQSKSDHQIKSEVNDAVDAMFDQ